VRIAVVKRRAWSAGIIEVKVLEHLDAYIPGRQRVNARFDLQEAEVQCCPKEFDADNDRSRSRPFVAQRARVIRRRLADETLPQREFL
jgi:hypothetical protein